MCEFNNQWNRKQAKWELKKISYSYAKETQIN